MADGADEFLNFTLSFFEKYSDLRTNDFYLTGESYAGKYLPLFTQRILQYNQDFYQQAIPMKATVIIDPYPAPVI